jgi:hypothetical protein
MGWRHHEEVGPDRTVHVWPEDDETHATEPGDGLCWCRPRALELDGGKVLVLHHDALDRSGLGRSA